MVDTTAFAGKDIQQQSTNRVLQDRLYKSIRLLFDWLERNDYEAMIRRRSDLLPIRHNSAHNQLWFQRKKGNKHVSKQAHVRADDRCREAGGGRASGEDVAGEVGLSKHTIYAWMARYGAYLNQAQGVFPHAW